MSGPARLCLATDSLDPSGVGEHMLLLGAGVRREAPAARIAFACPPTPAGEALLARAAALGLEPTPLQPWRPGETREAHTARLAGWAGALGLTALHAHAGIGWEAHALVRAGHRLGIPTVRTEHLPHILTDASQRAEHAEACRLASRVVCVSEGSRRSYLAAGLPEALVVAIPNGIEPAVPLPYAGPKARRDLDIPPDAPVLLTVGRLTEQKDQACLVETAALLVPRHPGLAALLAGDGPLRDPLRERIARHGLEGTVRLLGRRTDVPDLLAAADLFVLPSRFEGLPLVVLEAMAAGLPVVATRIGGTDEAVEHGVTGLLVEPGDAGALAEAVHALLANPARARAMGLAGRESFVVGFEARRMVADTLALYRGLGMLEGRPVPQGFMLQEIAS